MEWVGVSRQNDGAAVAACTEKLNTHSAGIMRVDVLTALSPFCPLAAWLRTCIIICKFVLAAGVSKRAFL